MFQQVVGPRLMLLAHVRLDEWVDGIGVIPATLGFYSYHYYSSLRVEAVFISFVANRQWFSLNEKL